MLAKIRLPGSGYCLSSYSTQRTPLLCRASRRRGGRYARSGQDAFERRHLVPMGTGPTMATTQARIRLPGSHRLLGRRFEHGHNARADSTTRIRLPAGPFDPPPRREQATMRTTAILLGAIRSLLLSRSPRLQSCGT